MLIICDEIPADESLMIQQYKNNYPFASIEFVYVLEKNAQAEKRLKQYISSRDIRKGSGDLIIDLREKAGEKQ